MFIQPRTPKHKAAASGMEELGLLVLWPSGSSLRASRVGSGFRGLGPKWPQAL